MKVYYNYNTNQILIVDQHGPEVTTTKLYHKAKLIADETIILSAICLCKWMVDVT